VVLSERCLPGGGGRKAWLLGQLELRLEELEAAATKVEMAAEQAPVAQAVSRTSKAYLGHLTPAVIHSGIVRALLGRGSSLDAILETFDSIRAGSEEQSPNVAMSGPATRLLSHQLSTTRLLFARTCGRENLASFRIPRVTNPVVHGLSRSHALQGGTSG
jgi:hypothetical protein